jgi:uroporphyrinogen decarboxylase
VRVTRPGRVSNLFLRALEGEAVPVPPIWLMRQAGRYHAPYQRLRRHHRFDELCRTPDLAAEVAMGPIDDFDFDAAILFSDLLFPLEALGFGLSYEDGPPKLDGRLTRERLDRFKPLAAAVERLLFQREAMAATRARLPAHKGLIGFVGGPWTLFVYAIEGSHAGPLTEAKRALNLYRAFSDRMVPLLVENIRLQFSGGADVVMIFDTAAGALAPETFGRHMRDDLAALARAYPGRLGYYAKGLRSAHRDAARLDDLPWAGIGLDMHGDLPGALASPTRTGFVQGNFDPQLLLHGGDALEQAIRRFIDPVRRLDARARRGWICGLGHGVLPQTPESSVRTFVAQVRESFA